MKATIRWYSGKESPNTRVLGHFIMSQHPLPAITVLLPLSSLHPTLVEPLLQRHFCLSPKVWGMGDRVLLSRPLLRMLLIFSLVKFHQEAPSVIFSGSQNVASAAYILPVLLGTCGLYVGVDMTLFET